MQEQIVDRNETLIFRYLIPLLTLNKLSWYMRIYWIIRMSIVERHTIN